MLGREKIAAFVPARDAARARRFYETILGLKLVEADGYALVFDANGTILRVQLVEAFAPPPFTVLGWQVANIDQTADELARRGVVTERYAGMDQDARGVWRSPSGARVAWFKDPDGNTLSITQA
jgi:catechol 2,3-dioxygenase-like lactoylglutathione lyase family enzyme